MQLRNICTARLAVGLIIISTVFAQQSWRNVTQDLTRAPVDPVDRQTRSLRNRFFDDLIGADGPLDQVGKNPQMHSVWERVGYTPEIITSDDAVALVSFKSFQCIASDTKRSVYTEVSLAVETVLKDTTGTLREQSTISLLLQGGRVKFASGKTVAWDIQADDHEIQPRGRYLIFLTYERASNFFIEDKTWQLSSGKAQPNTVEDELRAQRSTSQYAGLPEDVFVALVRKQLNASE